MEKPFLSGNIKLDEVSLRNIFLYNLNKLHEILTCFEKKLPVLARATCFGDLQNVVEELLSEVKVQLFRINDIFVQLKDVPVEKHTCTNNKVAQILALDHEYEPQDNLSKDLSLVFYLQKIIAIKKNYFYVLRSIANPLNDINIKQKLQYSCDECEENEEMFRLIAKEYIESTINNFLL